MAESAVTTCDWCGNPGHVADAHPLPSDHPHFDASLDDNPLMEIALRDFLAWRTESNPAPRRVHPLSPMEQILGAGPDVTCNEVVHWWPTTTTEAGDLCICGQTRKGHL